MQVSPEEVSAAAAGPNSVKKFALTTVSNLNDEGTQGEDVTQLADRLLGSEKLPPSTNKEIVSRDAAVISDTIQLKGGVAVVGGGSSAVTPKVASMAASGNGRMMHEVSPEEETTNTDSSSDNNNKSSMDIAVSSSSSSSGSSTSTTRTAATPSAPAAAATAAVEGGGDVVVTDGTLYAGSSASTTKLPNVCEQRLCREFTMQGLDGVEITSLDITSHGCYVLAGCGNGMVLLFDLTQRLTEPALVGQILAKGLHTNLLMTVKITEDCRYCFAGVTKGSSELLAVDLSKLPVWSEETGFALSKRPYGFVNDLVTCHSRSDPKLRGFGDAVRVRGDSRTQPTYRLASGLGIKNIHVWQFTPPEREGEQPNWMCMYDVATNGNTIESISFKMGGETLSSKSAGVCLRVWDLCAFDESAPEANHNAKPAYEDIANTQDSRALLDNFALGGTYEFAIVSLSAPKAANRDALEVPQRSTDDEDGNRRRRMMRQISSISATQDSLHAIILCADGGCLYFNKPPSADAASGGRGSLVELPSLPRDMDNLSQCSGRDWSLKRVGCGGEVVLLHATQASGGEPVKVVVKPIYLESVNVAPTLLELPSGPGPASQWTEWGYYANPLAVSAFGPPDEEPVKARTYSAHAADPVAAASASVTAATGGNSQTSSKKRGRKEKAPLSSSGGEGGGGSSSSSSRDGSHAHGGADMMSEYSSAMPTSAAKRGPGQHSGRGRPPLVPAGQPGGGGGGSKPRAARPKEGELRAAASKAANEEYRKTLQLPSAAKSSAFGYGYGFGQQGVNPEDCADDTYADYAFRLEEPPKVHHKPMRVCPPPRARRVVEAPFDNTRFLEERTAAAGSSSGSGKPSVANVVMRRFKSLCKHWIQSAARVRGGFDDLLVMGGNNHNHNNNHNNKAELGVCTLRTMGGLCVQQDRVRAQFIGEATRVVARHLNTLNESHGTDYLRKAPTEGMDGEEGLPTAVNAAVSSPPAELPLQGAVRELEVLISRYSTVVRELVAQQQLEISAATSMDGMGAMPVGRVPSVVFRHGDCWERARGFLGTVQLLVHSVVTQFRLEQEQEREREQGRSGSSVKVE